MKDNFELLIKIAKHLGIDTKMEEKIHEVEKSGKKIITWDKCKRCNSKKYVVNYIHIIEERETSCDLACLSCNDYYGGWFSNEVINP